MEKRLEGDAIILKLNEDLIAPNVKMFNINVAELLKDEMDHDELILDLENTENIDSVGVTFVVSLYKIANNEGRQFRVINSNSDIMQLFKLMKLNELFEMED